MNKTKLLVVDTVTKEIFSSGMESILETHQYQNKFGIFNCKEFVIEGRSASIDKETFTTKVSGESGTYTFTYNDAVSYFGTYFFSGIEGTSFDTSLTFSENTLVYKNGVLLQGGNDNDYTESDGVLTFSVPLEVTDIIGITGATGDGSSAGWTLTATISGTTTITENVDIAEYGLTLSDIQQKGDIVVVKYNSLEDKVFVNYRQNIVIYIGQEGEEFDYIDFFCDTPLETTFSKIIDNVYKDFCHFGVKCCIETSGKKLKVTGIFNEVFDVAKATLIIAKKA